MRGKHEGNMVEMGKERQHTNEARADAKKTSEAETETETAGATANPEILRAFLLFL